MTTLAPFAASQYTLVTCKLHIMQSQEEAHFLSNILAGMDPWRTLNYTSKALERYLLGLDASLYRYTVVAQSRTSGIVCVRYPWLRGVCLELIGLAPAVQGHGIGREILQWIGEQAGRAVSNVWILVSAFNTRARTFYEQQGFSVTGTFQDFVRPGYDELLLRKILH